MNSQAKVELLSWEGLGFGVGGELSEPFQHPMQRHPASQTRGHIRFRV